MARGGRQRRVAAGVTGMESGAHLAGPAWRALLGAALAEVAVVVPALDALARQPRAVGGAVGAVGARQPPGVQRPAWRALLGALAEVASEVPAVDALAGVLHTVGGAVGAVRPGIAKAGVVAVRLLAGPAILQAPNIGACSILAAVLADLIAVPQP